LIKKKRKKNKPLKNLMSQKVSQTHLNFLKNLSHRILLDFREDKVKCQ
jgi:hypothetical protein